LKASYPWPKPISQSVGTKLSFCIELNIPGYETYAELQIKPTKELWFERLTDFKKFLQTLLDHHPPFTFHPHFMWRIGDHVPRMQVIRDMR
jgi:hypothetical protein